MKLRKLISAFLILSLLAAPVQAAAAGTDLVSGKDAAAVLLENREDEVIFQQPNAGTGADLPEKFDLRELGVVTPVKLQNPFGTCWGFAAIAAAETSILSEMGKTYEETGLDLSEHHLTYFSRIPVVDGSQNGEGWHVTDPSQLFDLGGTMFMASSVFSSGIGVVKEDLVPYRGRESNTDSSLLFYNDEYSADDDWTLPEEYRLVQSYELEEASLLPSPAVYTPEAANSGDTWTRQNGYLGYDATATENIKKELLSGKAVSIAFKADESMPGEEAVPMYMNYETWAHYTFSGASATHAVTIVGYDDTYPVSNFRDHTNDPHGDGQPHMPEGDGAWIVKNSWGAETEDFPNHTSWGVPNEEGQSTGYFYLSYYDRSIVIPETFDFNVNDDGINYMIEQYDYLPSEAGQGWMDTDVLKMANIFTAENNGLIRNVSCETLAENADVTYEIYLLGDADKVPTDGKLATTAQESYRYPGYHRLKLEEPVKVSKGQRYAVVVTETVKVGDTVYYGLSTNCALNETGMNAVNYSICLDNPGLTEDVLSSVLLNNYAVGIVNPGESMVYMDDLSGWADWSDVITEFQKTAEFQYLDFDNFPVKAYLAFADVGEADCVTLPELNFAPPAEQVNTRILFTALLIIFAVIVALIIVAVILIRRIIKLKKHPELRKPRKAKKPSYKALKAQLDAANSRIAQLEQETAASTEAADCGAEQ